MHADRTDLAGFIKDVLAIDGTPALIQWLVEDAKRLETAKAIVTKQRNTLYSLAESLCTEKGLDIARLELRLAPAVGSLGLIEETEVQGDFYALLGVSSNADTDQIKSAYRRIMRRIHPDAAPDARPEAVDDPGPARGTDQITAITRAYKTLSNAALRRQYDQTRAHANGWQEAESHEPAGKPRKPTPWLKIGLTGAGLLILFAGLSLFFESVFYRQSLNEPQQRNPSTIAKSITAQPKVLPGPSRTIPLPPANPFDEAPPEPPPSRKPLRTKETPPKVARPKAHKVSSPATAKKQAIAPEPYGSETQSLAVDTPQFSDADPSVKDNAPPEKVMQEAPGSTQTQIAQTDIQPAVVPENGLTKTPEESEPSAPEEAQVLKMLNRLAEAPAPQPHKQTDIGDQLDRLTGSDRQQAIRDFVKRYAKVYESRATDRLLGLFAPGATQNGRSVVSLAEELRHMFTTLHDVVYRITIDQIIFDPFNLTANVSARFELQFQSGSHLNLHSGHITFLVVNDLSTPLAIRKLDYKVTHKQRRDQPAKPTTPAKAKVPRSQKPETVVARPSSDTQDTTPRSADTRLPDEQPEKAVSRRLEGFITKYKTCYESRDIVGYQRLFSEDALENGKPIQSRFPVYQKQFKELSEVQYQLQISEWEPQEGTQESLIVHCRYEIDYHRKGRRRSATGRIRFHLRDQQGELKITEMHY